MSDLQSSALKTKLQLKIHNLHRFLHSLRQFLSEPTHLLFQSLSCIDLIFTDQPNLITDSGAYPSLQINCCHQITHCKMNLIIEYERLV